LEEVWVEAPASSANLGPGFDTFALALEKPSDMVHLRATGRGELSITIREVTGLRVPASAGENGAGVVCQEMAKTFGVKGLIELDLQKGVPIGQGMGSSGASAAAAAVAMNELLGLRLSSDELVYYAGMGEAVTSGAPHYDNVAASLLGGFVIVREGIMIEAPSPVSEASAGGKVRGDEGGSGGARPFTVRFDPPEGVALCIATPVVRLPPRKTEYARSLIPSSVPLRSLVANVANSCLMVAGFAKQDIGLIGKGMMDVVVEQARKVMIPGYDYVRSMAIEAGAAGVCISGAGPSMLAIIDSKKSEPGKVIEAMQAGFKRGGSDSSGHVTRIGGGARVVESN
jgi:homoserine kinase